MTLSDASDEDGAVEGHVGANDGSLETGREGRMKEEKMMKKKEKGVEEERKMRKNGSMKRKGLKTQRKGMDEGGDK